jgi:hypothetical protein
MQQSAFDSAVNLRPAEAHGQQLSPARESTLQLGQASDGNVTRESLPQNPPQSVVFPKRVSLTVLQTLNPPRFQGTARCGGLSGA